MVNGYIVTGWVFFAISIVALFVVPVQFYTFEEEWSWDSESDQEDYSSDSSSEICWLGVGIDVLLWVLAISFLIGGYSKRSKEKKAKKIEEKHRRQQEQYEQDRLLAEKRRKREEQEAREKQLRKEKELEINKIKEENERNRIIAKEKEKEIESKFEKQIQVMKRDLENQFTYQQQSNQRKNRYNVDWQNENEEILDWEDIDPSGTLDDDEETIFVLPARKRKERGLPPSMMKRKLKQRLILGEISEKTYYDLLDDIDHWK